MSRGTSLLQLIDTSSYLTLEKLVLELSRAWSLLPLLTLTVRCENPSGVAFAHVSGVEMTRKREVGP